MIAYPAGWNAGEYWGESAFETGSARASPPVRAATYRGITCARSWALNLAAVGYRGHTQRGGEHLNP